MGKLNVKFGDPVLGRKGNRVVCSITWKLSGLSKESMSLLCGSIINKCPHHWYEEMVTVKPDNDSVQDNPMLAQHIAITKAKARAYEKAEKLLSNAYKVAKTAYLEMSEAAFYLGKTCEREALYISEISGIDNIPLENRDGLDLRLIKQQDGNYVLRGLYNSIRVIFYDGNKIKAIDPNGGPYLSIGMEVPKTGITIKAIKRVRGKYKIFV